jgi:putative hydrolase of the HAD superfamily
MSRVKLDPQRIRWIAFDAVGTLIRPEPSVAAIYHRVALRHGSRLSSAEVARRFREAFARSETNGGLPCGCAEAIDAWHTCEAREQLRWRSIVDFVLDDVRSREECFAELFGHFGRPATWVCFPDVEPTLASLSHMGIRLAVSSNFDGRLNAVMDGIPALAPIELRIISSEVGHRKPSPRFFERLLAETGCRPSAVLFVGDDWRNDVEAAEGAGVPALQVDREGGGNGDRRLHSLAELVHLLHPV